jgi:hypothetical protein
MIRLTLSRHEFYRFAIHKSVSIMEISKIVIKEPFMSINMEISHDIVIDK